VLKAIAAQDLLQEDIHEAAGGLLPRLLSTAANVGSPGSSLPPLSSSAAGSLFVRDQTSEQSQDTTCWTDVPHPHMFNRHPWILACAQKNNFFKITWSCYGILFIYSIHMHSAFLKTTQRYHSKLFQPERANQQRKKQNNSRSIEGYLLHRW